MSIGYIISNFPQKIIDCNCVLDLITIPSLLVRSMLMDLGKGNGRTLSHMDVQSQFNDNRSFYALLMFLSALELLNMYIHVRACVSLS